MRIEKRGFEHSNYLTLPNHGMKLLVARKLSNVRTLVLCRFFIYRRNKMNLITKGTKETISSLEIVEQINFFREQEGRSALRHDNLLRVIRDEFEEEISLRKIVESFYDTKYKKNLPMFNLTQEQVNALGIRIKCPSIINLEGVDVLHIHTRTRFELSFLEMLEEALGEFDIEGTRQFQVLGRYKLDFYIESLNLAIEYDEAQHELQIEKDRARQEAISKELGCKFIRLDYRLSDVKNVVKVLKEVIVEKI